MFGQRLRHARRAKGLTLAELGAKVGRTPSVLSLIENGKREPRLSLVEQLAAALGVPVTELLKKQPPSRRARLEIQLEQARGFSLYMLKAIMNGRGDEVVELAQTNWRR